MESFLSSVLRTKNTVLNREQLIKQTILDTLSDNVKEIQYELKEDEDENITKELDLCDHSQSLCSTIEAMFLHGLKDSFLSQTFNVLSGGEVNKKPAPNFWPPLLLFTHKHSIEQIYSLPQITSEIGYCRSWIRQSLNDCLLSSYITNMRKSSQALVPYYKNSAFVRDKDFMELAENFIGGIEVCVTFQLPLNSSLLNNWTDQPLQLSGVYVPPLLLCPIASGIDIANAYDMPQGSSSHMSAGGTKVADHVIPIPRTIQLDKCYISPITNSPFHHMSHTLSGYKTIDDDIDVAIDIGSDCNQEVDDDIEHDVRLNALLSKVDEMIALEEDPPADSDQINSEPTALEKDLIEFEQTKEGPPTMDAENNPFREENHNVVGNLLTLNRGWSSIEDEDYANNQPNLDNPIRTTESILSPSQSSNRDVMTKSMISQRSFNVCLQNIDFNEVWQRFEESVGFSQNSSTKNVVINVESTTGQDDENLDEYVVVQDEAVNMLKKFSIDELQEMVQQIYIIPRQFGLDAQNFACILCENPLGIGAAGLTTAQLCAFSGSYYCSNCMANELYEIPSRVINNWDFRKYAVSQRAAAFLHEFRYQAFIDMKLLNPDIYQYVNEMSELQSLRIQLNFIRAYLFTCCASIIENLQKQLWSKEYLYEHIHRYSLADIENIPKGILAEQLRKVIIFGKQHIFNCTLCSQKGYICEICQSNKILYPFDIETTMKCDSCGSVFHAECVVSIHTCPKCRRLRLRNDEILVDSVCST